MFKVHQKSYQKLDFPFQEDPIRPRTMPFCQKNFHLSSELVRLGFVRFGFGPWSGQVKLSNLNYTKSNGIMLKVHQNLTKILTFPFKRIQIILGQVRSV